MIDHDEKARVAGTLVSAAFALRVELDENWNEDDAEQVLQDAKRISERLRRTAMRSTKEW